MKKSIFDYSHVKGTTAICLLNEKSEFCGRIIANWSDNPNGTVCTVGIHLWGNCPGELKGKEFRASQGKAGGYGYDKLSQAIWSALKELNIEHIIKVEPASGNQQKAFEEAGFKFISIC